MRINDEHLYHGAAIIQIAEDKHFTAINTLKIGDKISNKGYLINTSIPVYVKYATKKNAIEEFVFTFTKDHINDIKNINSKYSKCFVVLVCYGAREICCLSYSQFSELLNSRMSHSNNKNAGLTVLVIAPSGRGLRAYVNAPGKKGEIAGEEIIVSRNDFPRSIFDTET